MIAACALVGAACLFRAFNTLECAASAPGVLNNELTKVWRSGGGPAKMSEPGSPGRESA